jgi:hypothetical protein
MANRCNNTPSAAVTKREKWKEKESREWENGFIITHHRRRVQATTTKFHM